MSDSMDEFLNSTSLDSIDNLIQKQMLPIREDKLDPKRRERIVKRKKDNVEKYIQQIVLSRIYQLAKENIEEIIGGTLLQMKDHIEQQLPKNWTWDNHGYQWHIDHITPIKYKNMDKKPNFIEMIDRMKYKNCQPLYSEHNIKKSNKYI